jgi:hypothetical protein
MKIENVHCITENTNIDDVVFTITKKIIEESRQEELLHYVRVYEEYYRINQPPGLEEPLQIAYRVFYEKSELDENGKPKRYDTRDIRESYDAKRSIVSFMYHRASTLGILDMEDDESDCKISRRLKRIFDQMEDFFQILFRHARMYDRSINPTAESEGDPAFYMGSTPDAIEELEIFQKVLIQILKDLYESNIRKYKGYCCEQIKTREGYDTRAWKQTQLIKEYVHNIAPKESRFMLWKDLTSKGTATLNQLIRYLGDCHDMQFPEIKKNRHLWSFKNGLFLGKIWSDKTGLYQSEFYPYDSKEAMNLDPREVSSKYFDFDFEDYHHLENWYDIPTPHFDKVLKSQFFEEDVCKWMYVMAGRLCFDLNDIDKWQIIPFLKGIARSGKSTLITKVIKKFYENDDIRTLSNNIETKFGLSSICDGHMFIAPEIKGDLRLEQAEFQSIVSGEDVSIAVKGEKAKNMTWNIPGILGGNEVPNWRDNSGSILRRLMTWDFKKQIKDKDTDPLLEKKLELELPVILQKCIRGYLEYAQKYQSDDIWNVIPSYFENVRKQVATITNPLEHYLQSDAIIIDDKRLCPLKKFKQEFTQYCSANNLGKPRFTQDFYIGPFSSRDLELKRIDEVIYGDELKPRRNEDFIVGLDVRREEFELSNS